MSQARRRQIARLEKLAGPKIKQVRQAEENLKVRIRNSATSHAIGLGALILFGNPKKDELSDAGLGALILYGNPKEDEPLSDAWQRCIERFPSLERWKVNKSYMSGEGYAREVAEIVLEKVKAELPGTAAIEKLQKLFSSAPPWLIWSSTSLLDLNPGPLFSISHCLTFRVWQTSDDPSLPSRCGLPCPMVNLSSAFAMTI